MVRIYFTGSQIDEGHLEYHVCEKYNSQSIIATF